MDDPRRLVDELGGSALSRALLASAQEDAPSPGGRARVARRLGIAAALTVGTGLGSEAGALAVASKLTAVVLALGGVVSLAVWQSPAASLARSAPSTASPRSSPSTPSTPSMPSTPAAVTSPPPLSATPTLHESPAAPALEAAPPETVRRAPAPRPALPTHPAPSRVATAMRAPSPPAPPAAPVETAAPAPDEPVADTPVTPAAPEVPQAASPSRLAAEVALVDRARERLAAGDHAAALAALAAYHQQFPSGDLAAAAEVVQLETLIAMRDVARARTLGAAFLSRFPRSPLAQRVHSLLERLPH